MSSRLRGFMLPAITAALACVGAVLVAPGLLVMPASARAVDLASEVARTGVWANTSSGTTAVWGSGARPCWSDVGVRNPASWSARFDRTPVPCNFAPSPGSDALAIVVDQSGQAPYDYFELWTTIYNHSAFPWHWSIGWGGAANYPEFVQSEGLRIWTGGMGAQASGIAFIPGLPRIAELQAGHIPHPVQIMVPEACASPKPPATRTDLVAVNSVNCIAEGQKYKLPAGYDCTPLRQVAEAICEAARDYYLVVTDQTHDKVIVRLEGAKPGQESPYYKVGGLFGCDGLQGGRPANGNEYDCWPTAAGEFHGFPWAALVAVN